MKAVKGNKEYDIVDAQKNGYQAAGFDIENDDGETNIYAAFVYSKTHTFESNSTISLFE